MGGCWWRRFKETVEIEWRSREMGRGSGKEKGEGGGGGGGGGRVHTWGRAKGRAVARREKVKAGSGGGGGGGGRGRRGGRRGAGHAILQRHTLLFQFSSLVCTTFSDWLLTDKSTRNCLNWRESQSRVIEWEEKRLSLASPPPDFSCYY